MQHNTAPLHSGSNHDDNEGIPDYRAMQVRTFFAALSETSAESQRAMLNLIHAASIRCDIIESLAPTRDRRWSDVTDERRLLVLGSPRH